MNLRNASIILLLTSLTVTSVFSQDTTRISYRTAQQNKFTISEDAVFINQYTGEVIPEDSVQRIIQANGGRISMHRRINKYGATEAYIVDVLNKDGITHGRQANAPGIVGEEFPSFAMRSTSGDLIDSDSLHGKWIILHFTLPFRSVDAEQADIRRMITNLSEISDRHTLTYVRVTTYSQDPSIRSEILVPDYWKYIDDGSAFQSRYGVSHFPTIFMIDPEGVLTDKVESGVYSEIRERIISIGD